MLIFLGGNGGGGSIFRTSSFPNYPSLMIILSSSYNGRRHHQLGAQSNPIFDNVSTAYSQVMVHFIP